MKNLVVANWKCNPVSKKEAENLFEAVKKEVKNANAEVVICPPFVYLPAVAESVGGLALGAQDCFWEDKGAFTGEVSPVMLKDLGIEYVIIGHSERRKYFGETDEIVNKKIKAALKSGLKIIFCVGETADERDTGKKFEVLEKQLKEGLKEVPSSKFQAISVAYEPVWAIGTGNNCSVEETRESIEFIKKFMPKGIRILYGGSVKSENSGDYIKKAGANGLLVGGASLNVEEFIKIVKSAE